MNGFMMFYDVILSLNIHQNYVGLSGKGKTHFLAPIRTSLLCHMRALTCLGLLSQTVHSWNRRHKWSYEMNEIQEYNKKCMKNVFLYIPTNILNFIMHQ